MGVVVSSSRRQVLCEPTQGKGCIDKGAFYDVFMSAALDSAVAIIIEEPVLKTDYRYHQMMILLIC